MGYTHYWTPKKVNDEQWNKFVDITKKMHNEVTTYAKDYGYKYIQEPIIIKGGDGTGNPIFGDIVPNTNKVGIVFNGDGGTENDHETFWLLKNNLDWEFCKTARKPYDLLVVGVLCAAKDILKFETSTDGDVEDWILGIKLYSDLMYNEVDKDIIMSIVPKKFFNIEFDQLLL